MILLDTHVVLWVLVNSDRLSDRAALAIKSARKETGLAICSVTLFEIAYLASRGRIAVDTPVQDFVNYIAKQFVVKDISASVAFTSAQLPPPFPGDPIDRIIGATAITERMPLVTADERIRKSGQVEIIW